AALLTLAAGLVLAASGGADAGAPPSASRPALDMPASDPAPRSALALATAQVVAVAPPAEPTIEPNAAPSRAVIGEMKHVWQSLNNCGPASVVMALSAMGIDVSQEDARVPLRGTNILSGMGPQKVDGWVAENFGLRSMWRNNGTNDLLRRLVANGFAAFAEAVSAFERGMSLGSVQGVFTLRSSYPQALRALGRQNDAAVAQQRLASTTTSSAVPAPPDPFALYLALVLSLPADAPTLTE